MRQRDVSTVLLCTVVPWYLKGDMAPGNIPVSADTKIRGAQVSDIKWYIIFTKNLYHSPVCLKSFVDYL